GGPGFGTGAGTKPVPHAPRSAIQTSLRATVVRPDLSVTVALPSGNRTRPPRVGTSGIDGRAGRRLYSADFSLCCASEDATDEPFVAGASVGPRDEGPARRPSQGGVAGSSAKHWRERGKEGRRRRKSPQGAPQAPAAAAAPRLSRSG